MSYCEDHEVLDGIADALAHKAGLSRVARESECVEFTDDATGRRFEVVVRPIDDPDDDDDAEGKGGPP